MGDHFSVIVKTRFEYIVHIDIETGNLLFITRTGKNHAFQLSEINVVDGGQLTINVSSSFQHDTARLLRLSWLVSWVYLLG